MTTDAQAALAQVREALAAGPRPGEWRVSKYRDGRQALIYDADDFEVARVCYPNRDADAAIIAACSPANMATILAHGEAQAAANERLTAECDELRRQLDEARAEREAMANVLPGVYYMDPPDGGSVPLGKQVRRMAMDAARYRLLRRKFAIISDGKGHAEFCAINLPRPTYIAPNAAIELDTALDRERLGLDGTRPPTPADPVVYHGASIPDLDALIDAEVASEGRR